MAVRRSRTIAATTALAAGLTLAGAVSAPASADTYGPPRVTRDADADVFVTAYDPDDELGLPGDTHTIGLNYTAAYARPLNPIISSYTCGPHDRSRLPHELGCPEAAGPALVVRRARVAVLADDRVRLRAETTAGRLDVALTGSTHLPSWEPFVSHEWRRAVGTTREQGRTVAIDSTVATMTRGTFGGVALYQDPAWIDWSGLRTRTTTVRTGVGPAVAIPDLPPPGTQDGEWSTAAAAQATWLRGLPGAGPAGTRDVEVGEARYSVDTFGGGPSGYRNVQRCEPGERVSLNNAVPPRRPCEVVAAQGGTDGGTADLDVAAGRLRVGFDFVPEPPSGAADHVTFTWRGAGAVGVHEVDTTRFDAIASAETFTREGIRWLRLGAGGTVAGDRMDRVLRLDLTVYRQKRGSTPPT
jgi:hypothetical protein